MPADFLENQRASLPARRGVPEEARGRLPDEPQHGAAAKAGDSGAAANLRSAVAHHFTRHVACMQKPMLDAKI